MLAPTSACSRAPGACGLPTSCQNAARRGSRAAPSCDGGVEHVQDVLVERVGLRRRLLIEPMQGAHSGSATASAPTSRASRSASTAPSPGEHALELLAHALGRQLGDARRRRGHQLARAHRAGGRRCCSARRRAGCAAGRRGRRSRAPRAARRAARSSRPPNGSIHSPVRTSRAIALTVKSRRSRSSRTGSSASASMRKSVCGLPV